MPPLVLASASAARAAMLERAGVVCERHPARVDEDEVKAALKAERASPETAAEALAELKAMAISRQRPGTLVIGADQMLDCGGIWFDKPADREQARGHLRALSGRTHSLITSAVVVRDRVRLWHCTDRAALTMRPLSDRFIDDYLASVGQAASASVGAYQLEGLGAQLFTRVEGDFFTVLGLPLLPLLEFLRGHGVLPR